MRLIKFRARYYCGKWTYWTPETTAGSYSGDKTFWQMIEDGNYSDPCEYTGLKDKNGVDVYEHDILKTEKGNGVVEWYEASGRWDVSTGEWALSGWQGNDWEVVGNIYNDLDLLSSTKQRQIKSLLGEL